MKKRDRDNYFMQIYNKTIDKAFYVALSIVKNQDTANDILQDSYLQVLQSIEKIYDENYLQAWVNKIVTNKAIDYLRKNNRLQVTDFEADENNIVDSYLEETDIDFIPELSFDYSETKRIIGDILNGLPENQRLCIYLKFYSEYTNKEISELLGVGEETIKSRIRYAKNKIEQEVLALEKAGTKLGTFSVLPFIAWLFKEEASAAVFPEKLTSVAAVIGSRSIFEKIAVTVLNTTAKKVVATIAITTIAGATMGALVANYQKEIKDEEIIDNSATSENDKEDIVNIEENIEENISEEISLSNQKIATGYLEVINEKKTEIVAQYKDLYSTPSVVYLETPFVFYRIEDLNADGVGELIITADALIPQNDNRNCYNFATYVYTYVDGKVTPLFGYFLEDSRQWGRIDVTKKIVHMPLGIGGGGMYLDRGAVVRSDTNNQLITGAYSSDQLIDMPENNTYQLFDGIKGLDVNLMFFGGSVHDVTEAEYYAYRADNVPYESYEEMWDLSYVRADNPNVDNIVDLLDTGTSSYYLDDGTKYMISNFSVEQKSDGKYYLSGNLYKENSASKYYSDIRFFDRFSLVEEDVEMEILDGASFFSFRNAYVGNVKDMNSGQFFWNTYGYISLTDNNKVISIMLNDAE